jgi:hypothetical protein
MFSFFRHIEFFYQVFRCYRGGTKLIVKFCVLGLEILPNQAANVLEC